MQKLLLLLGLLCSTALLAQSSCNCTDYYSLYSEARQGDYVLSDYEVFIEKASLVKEEVIEDFKIKKNLYVRIKRATDLLSKSTQQAVEIKNLCKVGKPQYHNFAFTMSLEELKLFLENMKSLHSIYRDQKNEKVDFFTSIQARNKRGLRIAYGDFQKKNALGIKSTKRSFYLKTRNYNPLALTVLNDKDFGDLYKKLTEIKEMMEASE